MQDLTNQELYNKGENKINGIIRVAEEARQRAIAADNKGALIAADRALAKVLEAHACLLELCSFASDIQPRVGGK